MGMKTAMSDSVIASTVKPTSRAPTRRRLPRRHAVFDVAWTRSIEPIRIASSTTKPVAMVSAI